MSYNMTLFPVEINNLLDNITFQRLNTANEEIIEVLLSKRQVRLAKTKS